MNILVIGGTKFFGIPMIKELINNKHRITIATRGNNPNIFGDLVSFIKVDRQNPENVKDILGNKHFDIVIDKVAYCSNDVKYLMNAVTCDRYIQMSTMSVYPMEHALIGEEEFDAKKYPLKWWNREDAKYGEVKRQAECAVCQCYNKQPYTLVRYPIVLGKNDYTKRLKFYIEHVMKGIPMHVDDIDEKISFIHENEAGKFIAWLVNHPVDGAINGCSTGAISPGEIISYIEKKSEKIAMLSEDGDVAPFNGCKDELTLDTTKAEDAGYCFSDIHSWIYDLIDGYIYDLNEREL